MRGKSEVSFEIFVDFINFIFFINFLNNNIYYVIFFNL